MSVLTDMNGSRHYCACLSFHEAIQLAPTKPMDEVCSPLQLELWTPKVSVQFVHSKGTVLIPGRGDGRDWRCGALLPILRTRAR